MENTKHAIHVSVTHQQLVVLDDGCPEIVYPVSTALNGVGETFGSECTPRGEHRVRLIIGRNCPENAVFVGRRFTGEIYIPELGKCEPDRDWILSRIVWLTGTQSGFNRGGQCDTLRRYIYIHGTPDTEPMLTPKSHGCIRMRNADVIDLCKRIETGMPVRIDE
jgi:hypothetical protein